MRLLYKLPLTALALLGAVPVLLALLAALLIAEPQWFLTTRTVGRAAHAFGGSWQPRWKTMSFDIRSLSFSEKQIRLRAQDLCFANAAAGAEGCLKNLDTRFDVRLFFFGAKLTKIYRLIAVGDHFTLDQSAAKLNAPAKKSGGLTASLPALLPEILRNLELESLRVDLPENRIIQPGGTLRGWLLLSLSASMPRPLVLKFEAERSSGTVVRHYVGEATLNSDILKGMPMTYLDGSGSLKAEGVDAKFKARVEQSGPGALAYTVSASAKVPARRVETAFKGEQKGQELVLNGSAGVWEAAGPVKSVQLKDCLLTVRLKPESTEWDAVKFSGGFQVEPGARGGGRLRRNLVKTLNGTLALSARSTPARAAADHFDAAVTAAIKPGKDWYELSGGLSVTAAGRASRPQELKISHKLGLGLKVARFEDLVEFLAHTRYSVPAPIHVLHGPVEVSLKSAGDSRQAVQEFDYTLVSGLSADRQRLKLEAGGKATASGFWTPARSLKYETGIVLRDVALQLPRIDIKGMTAFTPDSRIRSGAEAEKEDLAREEERRNPGTRASRAVQSGTRVKTAKPLILYSNLAVDPVPVGLDFSINVPPGNLDGTVELQAFRTSIFRRLASIDHIRFTGRARSPVLDLDGLVVYQAAEAKISIRLLGTTAKPQVEFESDPPMSQADIVAMLLFGKSPDQLDSDQQSSAANAQSAVSSSAFGLASLYLLASTPVEYVGYNPASKTYTVKFRLPGGATLQVGSDGQSRGVQLRKRISSHLAVQTEFTTTQAQGNIVSTLLEWYGRR